MSTIQWIPRSDADKYLNAPVDEIYLCAYPPVEEALDLGSNQKQENRASPKTNHWSLFLATSPLASIKVDPVPTYPTMKMTLALSRQPCLFDPTGVKIARLAAQKLTIELFLQTLQKATYDEYEFTADGKGCRYWIYSVLRLLQREDFLRPGSTAFEDALKVVETVWDGQDRPVDEKQQTGLGSRTGGFYKLV